jgi:hypothetical protein
MQTALIWLPSASWASGSTFGTLAGRLLGATKTVGMCRRGLPCGSRPSQADRASEAAKLGVSNSNAASRIAVLAEHKAGELIRKMQDEGELKKQGGDQKSNGHDDRLVLADHDITHNQSKR